MTTILDIETQTSTLEKQITQLKRRRNALAPLIRLPDELLILIFKLLQESGSRPDSDSTLRTRTLSSTCHQLREVALHAADVWTTLICRRERWAELCALRAGSAPLRLFIREEDYGCGIESNEDEEYMDSEDESGDGGNIFHQRLS